MLFIEQLGTAAVVHIQNPVRLSDRSEPEPDVTLLRPRADFYAGKRPTPEDVLLLVEVSDTTLGFDRDVKLPLYARAGIPEVWIVDLSREKVRAYSRPTNRSYQNTRSTGRGSSIIPWALPGLMVGVDDVLG
jgi:Uma2 family endonuclease